MQTFEQSYADLVLRVIKHGDSRATRNANTSAIFAPTITFDSRFIPLISGRKMYYNGVFGEFAAFVRGPKNLKDFEDFGCNYWKDWADADGNLNVDYGNAWRDYNGVDQLADVIDKLKNDPYNRRIMIDAWRPDRLGQLSLPCCHYSYQWFVRDGKLDMLWIQRSTDTMIGLPSDALLAFLFNQTLAITAGLKPGNITMILGDTHIYDEHRLSAIKYASVARQAMDQQTLDERLYPAHGWNQDFTDIRDFVPSDIGIINYEPMPPIKFEVIA